jgi:hypothetical protein
MPGITATYVKSVNGLTGQRAYEIDAMEAQGGEDYKLMTGPSMPPQRVLELDAGDFKVEGTTGSTIQQKMQAIANSVQQLEMREMEMEGDYRMSIRNYPLAFQ